MPGIACVDGDNASCEVNSLPASLSSLQPKWNASEFQCSICYELLLNPVVGSCGHDFCKHCIEEWKVSRQLVGQEVLCPICRAVLLPSSDQSFGVCIRLRETIEKLFPEQIAVRRRQAGFAIKARKCGGECGPATFPLSPSSPSSSTSTSETSIDTSTATTSNTTSSTSSEPTTATTSSGSPAGSLGSPPAGGGAPGPPGSIASYPLLDLDLLSRAAEQYRELSLLVSAITSVPAPAEEVVQAFTHAAASMAEHVSNRPGLNGAGPTAAVAAPLQQQQQQQQQQQAAELAQLFLSSGAALTSTAAASAQQQQYMFQQSSHMQPYLQLNRQDHSSFTLDPAAAAAAVATMSGPDAAASAAMAAQLAASASAGGTAISGAGGTPTPTSIALAARTGGFLEAALTLLTSAAATSTAAGQLRTLVSALHHQQQAAAAVAGPRDGGSAADGGLTYAAATSTATGDVLRTTANTVQQLTAEAAAMSHLLRMHHQHQLQVHMQAAAQAQAVAQAQAQAQVHAQAQSQQVLQLQQAAQQQQGHVQYLGPYLVTAAVPQAVVSTPPLSHQPPQMVISWGNTLATTASGAPVIIVGSPHQPAQQPNVSYRVEDAAANQQPFAAMIPCHVPFASVPLTSTAGSSPNGSIPAVDTFGWAQGSVAGAAMEGRGLGPWQAASTAPSAGQGSICYPLGATQVRVLSAQPLMAVAPSSSSVVAAGGGGMQPMAVSFPDPMLEFSPAAASGSLSAHVLPQRQQSFLRLQAHTADAAGRVAASASLTPLTGA